MSKRASVFRAAVFGIALAFLVAVEGCAPASAEKPEVKIGSKQFTESVILGEMMCHLVRHAGGEPEHLAELGGTRILFEGMVNREIDAYPEYIGTIVEELLAGEGVRDEEEIRKVLADYGIRMTGRLGFNNTYALAMREDHAQELKITKISHLADHPELIFKFSDEFMGRKDGWDGLKRAYGLPQTPGRMEHSLLYRAIAAGEIDVMDAYSTDAEITAYDLRLLEDDLGYFPHYDAVILYRADLARRAPEVVRALRIPEGRITTETMRKLNARVRLRGETETRVAAEFLNTLPGLKVDVPKDSFGALIRRRFGMFFRNTWKHLFLVAVSLAAAIAVAVPLGVASHKYHRLGQVILGVVGVIQTVPSLALLVFMIPLFGLGAWPAIVALFFYSLLPIVRNTYSGLHDISPNISESALALGLPPLARLWRVELPIASRSILAGIKTAAVINVGTATIGALIGAGGYGEPILTGIRLHNNWLLLQGAVPAALLALLIQALFGLAEKFLVSPGLEKPA